MCVCVIIRSLGRCCVHCSTSYISFQIVFSIVLNTGAVIDV